MLCTRSMSLMLDMGLRTGPDSKEQQIVLFERHVLSSFMYCRSLRRDDAASYGKTHSYQQAC